jgi:hypothetical protein
MVVDISFISQIGFVLKSIFQSTHTLFVFVESIKRKPQFIKNLCIILIHGQSLLQVSDGFNVLLEIIEALGPVHQEIRVFRLLLYCQVEKGKSLVEILQGMVATSLTVIDSSIFLRVILLEFQALFEVINGFMVPSRLELRDSSSVECFRESFVNFNGCIEVINSELVVPHILIDESSCNIDCLIIWQFLEDVGETLE